MFRVVFLHTGIVRHVLGVFLHVMGGRVGNSASGGHGMADVISQRDRVTVNVPTAAIICQQQEPIVMTGFL